MLAERVEYLDENGNLVTESLRDYSRMTIRRHYASLDQFLHRWQATERKEAIIAELATEGLFLNLLLEEISNELAPRPSPRRSSGSSGKRMTYSSMAVQIHSAIRSAAMIMVACVLARVTCGKIEPSTTRRPVRPCTRPY